MMDMEEDIFAVHPYGKAALKKMAPVHENFRLYSVAWMEDHPKDFNTMRVKGAEFRAAKTGKDKGKLSIMVEGTKRTVYVTKIEIEKEAVE